jgi:DNA gyrase subunit A
MPLTAYRKQGRGGVGIIGSEAKEGDFAEHLFIASTHDYLLFFTNNGRMYWLKVYDVPSMARQSKGRAIVNLLETQKDETICAVIPVDRFDEQRFLMTATRAGQVKKTPLSAYANPRKGGIQATGLDEGDLVIGAALTKGNDQIVLATRDGMAIRFDETDVRPMGRIAAGVRGVRLRKGDEVVDMAVVDPTATLLTVCENGYGKRTKFEEYRVQSRGGLGIINIRTSGRNGKVVAVKTVRDSDELMLITHDGMVVRIGVGALRAIGRATQGVRLMTLRESTKVVAVAGVAAEAPPGAAPEPAPSAPSPDSPQADPSPDGPQ